MVKRIALSQGKYAIVDDEDFEELNLYKWSLKKDSKSKRGLCYAIRSEYPDKDWNKSKTVIMHRVIMNAGGNEIIDHINGDGLDNRKENLRVVSNRANLNNRHSKKKSKYPGIYFSKKKRWIARITINGKRKYIGSFKNEKEAYKAYKNEYNKLEKGE